MFIKMKMKRTTTTATTMTMIMMIMLLANTTISTTLASPSPPENNNDNNVLFNHHNIHHQQHQVRNLLDDYSCDIDQDKCPFQYDGECDKNIPGECSSGNGDCFDCDLCRQYDFDCSSCKQQNGCNWCPGDARCYNNPNYNLLSMSCKSPDDYYNTSSDDDDETICYGPGESQNFFNDPLYSAQKWVFDMINLEVAWSKGLRGNGIRVRINDNGVESTHTEFFNRFDYIGSCDNMIEPQKSLEDGGNHGTSVAAIVGGSANNNKCSVGIAPEVILSACYAFGPDDILAHSIESMDISSNSWGTNGCSWGNPSRQRDLMPNSYCPFDMTVNSEEASTVCQICSDFSSYPLSEDCQKFILNYCFKYYEVDTTGCLEVVDLLIEDGECIFRSMSQQTRIDISRGITEGRDGKGIIYVWAGGNSYPLDDTNFQSYTNSRLTITVGSVGKDRKHARYSTPGASNFVVAPGGDFESISNHVTAGLDGSCMDAGVGTSFACPVVSGVIALMLEIRPDLSWRDIQGILAVTSQQVENDDFDDDDSTATINAVGLWHSNKYGFGIVDAGLAVTKAENWTLFGTEKMIIGESGMINQPISDADADIETTHTISITDGTPASGSSGRLLSSEGDGSNFVIESVVVYLDIKHISRGHLQVTLTSPYGTTSILSPGNRPEATVLSPDEQWKLLTVKNWGESPIGDWKLTINDLVDGDVDLDCIDNGWILPLEPDVNCEFLERNELCIDGQLDPNDLLGGDETLFDYLFTTTNNNMTAIEACCSCGGGITEPENFVDLLRQWKLVLYGRYDEIEDGDTTTASPTISSSFTIPPSMESTPIGSGESSIPPTIDPSFPPSMESTPVGSESSSKSPSTAAPIITTSPPTSAAPIGTTSPSTSQPIESPTTASPSTQSPVDPNEGEDQTSILAFPGITMRFEGITDALSVSARRAFQTGTENFYHSLYKPTVYAQQGSQSNNRNRSIRRKLQDEVKFESFETDVTFTFYEADSTGTTVTYNQLLRFTTADDSAVVDRTRAQVLLISPFLESDNQEKYITLLSNEDETYKDVSEVGTPQIPGVEGDPEEKPDEEPEDGGGGSAGTIIGVIFMVCLCLGGWGGGLYYFNRKKQQQSGEAEELKDTDDLGKDYSEDNHRAFSDDDSWARDDGNSADEENLNDEESGDDDESDDDTSDDEDESEEDESYEDESDEDETHDEGTYEDETYEEGTSSDDDSEEDSSEDEECNDGSSIDDWDDDDWKSSTDDESSGR